MVDHPRLGAAFLVFLAGMARGVAEEETARASVFWTLGDYSNGKASKLLETYVSFGGTDETQTWLGYKSFEIADTAFDEAMALIGTSLPIGPGSVLELDYFHLTDSTGGKASIRGAEYLHRVRARLLLGAGHARSYYPDREVRQFTARVAVEYARDSLFTAKVFHTSSKGSLRERALALLTKVERPLSGRARCTVGGCLGPRVNPVETDISAVYDQPELLERSLFGRLDYRLAEGVTAIVSLEHSRFETYAINYITAGVTVGWQ